MRNDMNKSVAWLNGNEICPEIGYEVKITTEHPKDLGWIPLYTHPVKDKPHPNAMKRVCIYVRCVN